MTKVKGVRCHRKFSDPLFGGSFDCDDECSFYDKGLKACRDVVKNSLEIRLLTFQLKEYEA